MRKIVVFSCLIRLLCLAAAGDPVITEFSASNQSGLQDEDGDRLYSSGIDAKGRWWCKARLTPDEGAVFDQAVTTARDDRTFTELGHDRPAGTTLASTPGDLAPEGHRVPGHPRRRDTYSVNGVGR